MQEKIGPEKPKGLLHRAADMTWPNRVGIRFDQTRSVRDETGDLMLILRILISKYLKKVALFCQHHQWIIKEERYGDNGQYGKMHRCQPQSDRADETEQIERIADDGVRAFTNNSVLFIAADVEAAPYTAKGGDDDQEQADQFKQTSGCALVFPSGLSGKEKNGACNDDGKRKWLTPDDGPFQGKAFLWIRVVQDIHQWSPSW